MIQEDKVTEKQPEATRQRRGRKSYPVSSFEDVLPLSKGILAYGAGDSMRKLTLFDKLGRSPDSSSSRMLITTSNKYGLTSGGYQAEYINLTEDAKELLGDGNSTKARKQKAFEMAIGQIELFNELYEKLKNKRIPDIDVLKDEIMQLGISRNDSQPCSDVFLKNIRYLGITREVAGSERLIPIEQLLEELSPEGGKPAPSETKQDLNIETKQKVQNGVDPDTISTFNGNQNVSQAVSKEPSVHIDIQIHIDSSAETKQIDQIFASMAKHLYGKSN